MGKRLPRKAEMKRGDGSKPRQVARELFSPSEERRCPENPSRPARPLSKTTDPIPSSQEIASGSRTTREFSHMHPVPPPPSIAGNMGPSASGLYVPPRLPTTQNVPQPQTHHQPLHPHQQQTERSYEDLVQGIYNHPTFPLVYDKFLGNQVQGKSLENYRICQGIAAFVGEHGMRRGILGLRPLDIYMSALLDPTSRHMTGVNANSYAEKQANTSIHSREEVPRATSNGLTRQVHGQFFENNLASAHPPPVQPQPAHHPHNPGTNVYLRSPPVMVKQHPIPSDVRRPSRRSTEAPTTERAVSFEEAHLSSQE